VPRFCNPYNATLNGFFNFYEQEFIDLTIRIIDNMNSVPRNLPKPSYNNRIHDLIDNSYTPQAEGLTRNFIGDLVDLVNSVPDGDTTDVDTLNALIGTESELSAYPFPINPCNTKILGFEEFVLIKTNEVLNKASELIASKT
jgi:hypothetical protein